MTTEGIFRRSANASDLKKVQKSFNEGIAFLFAVSEVLLTGILKMVFIKDG